MKTKMFVAMLAVLALMVGSAQAAYVELYNENFESSNDLDLLSDSPHSWAKYGAAPQTVKISDDTNLDGLAIDGSTISGDSWTLYNSPTFTTFEQGKIYSLSFDAYASGADVGSDVGLAAGTAGFHAAVGPEADGWSTNWSGVTGAADVAITTGNEGLDERVHVVIYFDLGDTDQIWISVSDDTTTWTTAKYGITGNQGMQTVGYWDNQLAGSFDVDNIVVAEIPEPVTLATLAFGGVLALLRRRR